MAMRYSFREPENPNNFQELHGCNLGFVAGAGHLLQHKKTKEIWYTLDHRGFSGYAWKIEEPVGDPWI
jgi:hypothetical protein